MITPSVATSDAGKESACSSAGLAAAGSDASAGIFMARARYCSTVGFSSIHRSAALVPHRHFAWTN